ncbi:MULTISPECIES: hypothetical protein [Moraxella]|nr:hypothetical protein [Moraxella catarrhalis]
MSYISVNTYVDIDIEDIASSLSDENVIKLIDCLPIENKINVLKGVTGEDGDIEKLVKTLDRHGLVAMLEELADAARDFGKEYVVLKAIKELEDEKPKPKPTPRQVIENKL